MIDHDPIARTQMMALRRRDILALLAGAAGSAILPEFALAADAPRKGGVLKISAAANPSSLDPMTGGSGLDHSYLWTMYDTLVEWDYESLTPKPGLARWSSTFSRTWRSTMARRSTRRR